MSRISIKSRILDFFQSNFQIVAKHSRPSMIKLVVISPTYVSHDLHSILIRRDVIELMNEDSADLTRR